MSEGSTDTEAPVAFESNLSPGPKRYLAYVIEHALEIGRRTPADFIRHFPASDIMAGLEHRPALRAEILEPTTGVRKKIALKKSAESAGTDLQIALDEGVTNAEQIVSLFRPDDRVQYLDSKKLWAFLAEGEFWTTKRDKSKDLGRAKQHIAFMLDRALVDKLVTHRDLIDGVSVESLAEALPRELLGRIINAALALGKNKNPFTEQALLETAAADLLVESVSLPHIWDTTILQKIATQHGFVEPQPEPAPEVDAGESTSDAAASGNHGEAKKSVDDKPAKAKSAPAKAKSEPAKAKSEPAKAKSAPAKAKSEPAKAARKPAAKAARKQPAPKPVPAIAPKLAPSVPLPGLPDDDDYEHIEELEIEEEFEDQSTQTGPAPAS